LENGEKHIGSYQNNRKHGKGKEFYGDGSIKYDGEYSMDYFEGHGICNF